MAGPWKVNFLMKQGQNGWSETYYNLSTDLAVVTTHANELAAARNAINGSDTELSAVRLSDTAVYKDASLSIQTPPLVPPTIFGESDNIGSAVYVRCEFANFYHRAIMMRGLPDQEIFGVKKTKFGAAYAKTFEAFTKKLENAFDQWAIRCEQKVGDPTVPAIFDTAVRDVSASGKPTTVTSVAHGLSSTVPTKIHLVGIKGAKAANGIHMAIGVPNDPDKFLLPNVTNDDPYQGGGRWWVVNVVYRPILKARAVRYATRDTGRPYDLSRGSRRHRQAATV